MAMAPRAPEAGHPVSIERRPNARIVRSALDEVRAIQTLLADVHKDAGDGRTLVRELVQNADDARAERLAFAVLDQGWPEARNGLLRGPALLVANDGPFLARDWDALHQAIGGSKADDAGKVGRFGIGLKSVFHVCEAIVYVGAEKGGLRLGALNPWAGTGEPGDADPIHWDWDAVEAADLNLLLGVARELLGNFDDGVVLWIPLRLPEHLDRGEGRQYGLGQACPAPDDLARWFGRSASLALLLAQCGHLRSIEAHRAPAPQKLRECAELARVKRRAIGEGGWVGRHDDDARTQVRPFAGTVDDGGNGWSVVGVDALGQDTLRRLRAGTDWPDDRHWRDGRSVWVPRKALAHAAVTILRRAGAPAEHVEARLRWAVFLPLDDDPDARTSAVVETVGNAGGVAWDIVLHGYFWPSHDRRSIPGVTDDDAGAGDGAVRVRWNRAVRDELLLPLLPDALESAFRGTPEGVVRRLLGAIEASRTVQTHLPAITKSKLLLPVLTGDRVTWEARDPAGTGVLSVPRWDQAPNDVRTQFADCQAKYPDVVFIDANAPRLGGEPGEWPVVWIERVMDCVPVTALRTLEELRWVKGLAHHLLGPKAGGNDDRLSAVARWLAQRIGEGALAPTTERASDDAQPELKVAWRSLFEELPEAWLVDAPVEAQRAVVELAVAGLVGAGLCPVPLGRRGAVRAARPDANRLDTALLELGNRLKKEEGSSQRARRSRLLLAETLLSARGDRRLGGELGRLPLLRALSLPDGRDEAWSVAELRCQTDIHRVFARPGAEDGDDGAALESPSDPKRAVSDLAEALGENVWLVDDSVASTTGAPVPTPNALAASVLHGGAIRTAPSARVALLGRLAASGTKTVHPAMRKLLTGLAARPGEEELLYVRSQDTDRDPHRKTLEILLRLLDRSWRAIEPALVEPLPHALVEDLHVRAVDAGRLHRLLDECLQGRVDWTRIERAEALHLLRRLFGTAPEERTRWRAMPLHRGAGGDRGAFDDRALRTAGGLRLPEELKAEIRILDPDPELADLYRDVPALDDDGILHAMLVSARPHRFADRVVQALRPGPEARVTLPRDPALLDLLRRSAWLPGCDVDAGVAPEAVLLAPPELRAGLKPLAAAGALGNHRLPDDIAPAVWRNPEDVVVHEILGRPTRARQVQRVAQALKPDLVARVDDGTYLILPDAARVEASLVEDALQTPLAGAHLGWRLVHTVMDVLSVMDGQLGDEPAAAPDAVIALARSLCGPVPSARQTEMLQSISSAKPAKDSPGGRLFRSLVESFAATAGFFALVLPKIALPTQDGQWHPAREVARSASGVARRHRLVSDLRFSLRLDRDEPVQQDIVGDREIRFGTTRDLANYFKPWADRVPSGAVGAFLCLLGNGEDGAIRRLAEQWLGDDVSLDRVRSDLGPGCETIPWATLEVVVSSVARKGWVNAANVLGRSVRMHAGADDDTIFATDPLCRQYAVGAFNFAREVRFRKSCEVSLRDVTGRQRTAPELVALLRGTVEWWAVRVLHLELHQVRAWWSRWGTGSQAQVGPVRASILAHLPLTLRQLDVGGSELLGTALREAERTQRRREQTPHLCDAVDAERSALDRLAALVDDRAEHEQFLWGRVQERIRRFGYREDSVLLELAQNADDALAQAAEIAGCAPPSAACRLVVRVHEHLGVPTIDVIHHGRPINDTGGPDFPAGRDRQWDQDLYFMMLLNLSGKPGEEPGQAVASSTTGRFGLGFKAVHLVSSAPSVVSGFLAFSIAGGLLPQEQPMPADLDLAPAEGHRATRVRLPLRRDVEVDELLRKLFRRFAYARTLLPVFARQLREVVVDGGPSPGKSVFDAEAVDGAPGWSVAAGPTEMVGHGQYRIVRFRPADGGTAALAFGLRGGVAAPFPQDLPFLWNVTPTSEGWGCGYAVNGPFKLDPGRTHVSLDDAATLRVVDGLGVALGRSLIELHDALVREPGARGCRLPTGADAQAFLTSLWTVLVSGLDGRDDKNRRDLLRCLHGPGRGLSVWMSARAVVPCGLPAPFPAALPPVAPGMRIDVAVGGLDDPDLCRAFAEIEDVVTVVKSHRVVSGEVAQRLRPLLNETIRALRPADILAEVATRWGQVLTPARLHALRPLASDALWETLAGGGRDASWHSQLVAQSADGRRAPLRDLLIPRDLEVLEVEADAADESLRAAFAPDWQVLDPEYIARAEDRAAFQRLRVRHQINAATMAEWCADLPARRRPAALRYLLCGKLQQEVLRLLLPAEARPSWLKRHDDVRRILGDLRELGVEEWRSNALLAALFPERFQPQPEPASLPGLPEAARQRFFTLLLEWWNQENVRGAAIQAYEAEAWPEWLRLEGIANRLREGSRDHWLGLLVLGACQSLGRAQDGHHRTFLDAAHDEGWWEVFLAPESAAPWMEVLRTWQDRSVADLRYSRWMSLFPAIYQLSRYLETYRRLLSTAGRRPAEFYRVTCLLAPRVDEALLGAGQHFDAPPAPLNMGLHWILRELVRLGVLDGDHVLPDCWVPSEQVLRFLRPLGMATPDRAASNSEKAHAVFAFLAAELGTRTPHLHRAFDIPLRHVDTDPVLRRQLGLEG